MALWNIKYPKTSKDSIGNGNKICIKAIGGTQEMYTREVNEDI